MTPLGEYHETGMALSRSGLDKVSLVCLAPDGRWTYWVWGARGVRDGTEIACLFKSSTRPSSADFDTHVSKLASWCPLGHDHGHQLAQDAPEVHL